MDHKDLQDQLVDYLYDELDADAKAEFERALADDEEIRLEVEAFQQTRQAFGEIADFEVPAAISATLMEEAARAAPTPVKAPGFWQQIRAGLRAMVAHPAMGAAAVMIAVIGMSFYAYRHGAPPSSPTAGDRISETLASRPPPATAAETPQPGMKQVREQAEGESARDKRLKEETKASDEVTTGALARKVAASRGGARGATPAQQQQPQGQSVGSIQVKTRDDRLAAAPSPPMKRRPRRRSRVYKKKSPAAKRPAGSKGDALDDLGNIASERREGYAGRAGNAAPKAAAPMRASAAKPVQTQSAKRKKSAKSGERKLDPRGWLALGRKAAAAGRCSLAFDYFTRALSGDGSLAGTVSDSLGRCRSQLGGKGPHVWLASRVQIAERKRMAQRKKAKAKKRASKKAADKKARPSSLE